MDQVEFDKLILNGMPTFIARRYQTLLETTAARDRVQIITRIYELWLRMLTIILVSQYLLHNREREKNAELNKVLEKDFDSLVELSTLLLEGFDNLTIDGWKKVFFKVMETYQHKRDLFSITELYDFYWDTAHHPHTSRKEEQAIIESLAEFSAKLTQQHALSLSESEWEEKANKLNDQLHLLLQATTFLASYDLIRVLEVLHSSYTFELFKGAGDVTTHGASSGETALFPGRFYLRARSNALLSLHPLLIFWDEQAVKSEEVSAEVALYDHFLSDELFYLLSTSDDSFPMKRYLHAFIEFFYGSLQDARQKYQQARQLTWEELKRLSADITQQCMETARGKYSEDVYLQRQKTLEELLRFLDDSPERCFVLIGRSGVGKTNFLLSFNQYLRETRPDTVCMLMYDGALLHSDKSLEEIIKQDFEERITIPDKKIESLWQEIGKIASAHNRRVILCVDAINESASAQKLLQQLDDLVQRSAKRPWLKIIFSSRPETWQAIRRGVNLDESKYYRAKGSSSVENPLEGFNYSEQMDPFTPQELSLAYVKYQAKFSLQTPFTDLSFSVKEVLREPLNLLLVATTYQNSVIPNRIRVTELVKLYIHSLLKSQSRRKLEEADVELLEQRLVPIMVSGEHYDNKITLKEIRAAGGGLHEAIYSDSVNQAFNRLADLSILTHQKTGSGPGIQRAIAFKYERFYEYFIGKRLAELSADQLDKVAFYLHLIKLTPDKPFLWGAIRNALLQQLDAGDTQTITILCYSNHQHVKEVKIDTLQRVKEMMIDTLTSYGVDQPEQVEPLLRRFTPIAEKTSSVRQALQFIRRSGKAPDTGAQNAGKIAAEVASNLGFVEILQRAGLQPDSAVRAATVRFGYLLWKRDRQAGFAVLDYLGKETARHLIPNLAAFESALGLSLIIIFDHPHDGEVLEHLQHLWHMIIGRLLGISESSNRFSRLVRSRIRESLFSFAISLAFLWIKQLPENLPIRDPSFEAFFHRNAAEKALYRRLTRYIDPTEGAYTYEEVKQDFLAAIPIMDGILQPVSCIGLSVHLARNPSVALPLMRDLFDAAENAQPPNLWLTGIAFAVTPVLDTNPNNDEVFECFFEFMERCQRYYAKPGHSAAWIDVEDPQAIFLGQYIYYDYKRRESQRKQVAPDDWLKSRITTALKLKNEKFFKLLLSVHLPLVAFEMEAPQPVFDTLAFFFKERHQIAEMGKLLSTLLGRMRTRYPDAVDAFLEEQKALLSDKEQQALAELAEFRLQVITSESPEKVGDLLGLRLFRVAFSLLVADQPVLRDRLIGLFARAADCKNLRGLIDYLLREVINVIYQGEALRQ
ncbi:MAG TPA: hypothetical protein VH593_00475, partial [Ktedonobacteraceae bacterium]